MPVPVQVLLRVSTLPVSRPAAAIKLMARVFGRVGQILWQCNLTHSGRLSNQLDRLEDQELEGGGACVEGTTGSEGRNVGTIFSSLTTTTRPFFNERNSVKYWEF